MKALKRLKNFAGKKQKKESRKASIVISATLILHAQLCFPLVTKAQTSPIAPTTESIPASEHGSPLPPPQAPGASNVLTPEITSLLVPSANQTQTIFDVGNTQGVLHFTDLINTDSLHIVSTNAQYSTATIFASGNIINAGTITTLIPTGFTGAISNLNLVLNAGGSIFNSGTISSAGSLNLTAGNVIVNVVTPQLPQSIPVMQAQTDLVMQATSIINQGTINSAIGNVNLCSATSNLAINNIAGTISAPNGFINVFTADMLHSATLDILGGDFVSRALKLKSGLVSVDVNSISGPVNLTAVEAALVAHTGTLEFGTANVSGDRQQEQSGSHFDLIALLL
ncbi:MAG: hypothetical protein K2X77_20495 [Candidatus Obscuribacterales bacterium]|jgi:hypothetical protein|nr:hypothetical protein [Candidatus Obscuribacterales bacterium]